MNERPVGVAVVGYGYWGANLARNVAIAPTTHLVGVVEPHEPARDQAAKSYPSATTWSTLTRRAG